MPELVMVTKERMLSFWQREKVTACEEEFINPITPKPQTQKPLPLERVWRGEECLIIRGYRRGIILYVKDPTLGREP